MKVTSLISRAPAPRRNMFAFRSVPVCSRRPVFLYFASEVIALGKLTGHNTVKMFKYTNITGVCEICESFKISLSSFFFFSTTYLRRCYADGVCLSFSFGGRIHCAYNVPTAPLCLGLWAVCGNSLAAWTHDFLARIADSRSTRPGTSNSSCLLFPKWSNDVEFGTDPHHESNLTLTFRHQASYIYRTGIQLLPRVGFSYIYSTNIINDFFKAFLAPSPFIPPQKSCIS